ncbi:MAG: hypothetical protein JO188_18175 [Hyphomicrobiales bacterium]|nr:hypothetical protein [Hyphomicrobiales bacterium]
MAWITLTRGGTQDEGKITVNTDNVAHITEIQRGGSTITLVGGVNEIHVTEDMGTIRARLAPIGEKFG